jgi:transposase
MARFYRSADRAQQFLLPPAVSDWLPKDHLVWFVLDVVDMIDMSGFHVRHPNDGAGRPAYEPETMLALLVYGYCTGIRSSRKIAAACTADLAFMVICGGISPEHRSVARFRQVHEAALKDAFADVLELCWRAGLVELGTIAIDGTKLGADAALAKNRSKSWIAGQIEQILAEAATADEATEPDLHGCLPEDLARPGSRRARLEEALRQIEADEAAETAETTRRVEEMTAQAEAGRRSRGRKPKDPDAAVQRAELDLKAAQVRQDAATDPLARVRSASAIERAQEALDRARAAAATAEPKPERQANITDPDSRIMKTAKGWLQGYNGQAAVNENQIVVAATLTNHANDTNEFVPVMNEVTHNLEAIGVTDIVGTYLADAGYCTEDNITAEGPDRLIATQKDWKQRKAAREMGTTTGPPPETASPIEQMEHRLRTPDGTAIYKKRSGMVEPIFGQTKEDRGIRRLMRRGITAAQSEWSLICWTGNIRKLFTHADGRALHTIINPAT